MNEVNGARGVACNLAVLATLVVGTASLTVAAAESSGNVLEEIIVTAQKREESAQDIPMSLYALTGEALEVQGISNVQDLTSVLAGVYVAAINPGQMNLTIRGISDISGSNQASPVNGFYLDETVISYVPGFMPELNLWDLKRVEVLRGPQGTLFGEGSVGGLLRVITKKPDSTQFFGRYQVGLTSTEGGGNGYSALASINAPLQKDVLAMSIAASYTKSPGWIDVPDLNEKDINESDLTNARIALRYTPSEALTVDAFYLHNEADGYDNGATEPGILDPASLAPGTSGVNALSPVNAKLDVGSLTISYDFGAATLVSASAITNQESYTDRDFSAGLPLFFGDPEATGHQTYLTESRAFTQELRLVSNGDDRLDWTIGAFYDDEDRDVTEGNYFSIPAFGGLMDTLSTHSIQTGSSWAVFGEMDYELTEALSAKVGVRYFSEDKDFSNTQLTSSVLFGTTAGDQVVGSDSASDTSPMFSLSYELTPESLVFARVAKGFRSGGSNIVPLEQYPYANADYDPDSLWSYEIGLKTVFEAGWYVNAYVFLYDWSDLQLPFSTDDNIYGYTDNAGSATSKGGELEIGGFLTDNWMLGVAYSYAKSTIDSDVFDEAGNLVAADGNHIPQSPESKLSLTTNYTTPITDALDLGIDGRYRIMSSFFSDSANLLENDDSKDLFLSVGVTGGWGTVRLYGNNLLDRDDSLAKYRPIGALPFVYVNYVRPRTFGIEYLGQF